LKHLPAEVGRAKSGGEEEEATSMAISGKLGLEVGEPPGGGEEDVASMIISFKPGPEVGEPPGGGGGEEEVASMIISFKPCPETLREKAKRDQSP
jgi:hypothetical protein